MRIKEYLIKESLQHLIHSFLVPLPPSSLLLFVPIFLFPPLLLFRVLFLGALLSSQPKLAFLPFSLFPLSFSQLFQS